MHAFYLHKFKYAHSAKNKNNSLNSLGNFAYLSTYWLHGPEHERMRLQSYMHTWERALWNPWDLFLSRFRLGSDSDVLSQPNPELSGCCRRSGSQTAAAVSSSSRGVWHGGLDLPAKVTASHTPTPPLRLPRNAIPESTQCWQPHTHRLWVSHCSPWVCPSTGKEQEVGLYCLLKTCLMTRLHHQRGR